jgi:hypothetical protein
VEQPTTLTGKIYIIKCNTTGSLSFSAVDMTKYGYTTLGVRDITLDIPQDVDVVTLQVESIKEQQRLLKLDIDSQVTKLEDNINTLLKTKN